MGTGAELAVPLLISGAATGASVLNQEAAARRADRITAQGIRQQGVRQRDVNARVDQEIGRVAGSDPTMEQQASQVQYLEQLRRSRAAARGAPGVPGASERYSQDVVAGDATVDANAARIADLMSRTGAPLLQREREVQGLDRLRSDVGVIGRAAGGDDFLNQLRLRAVRPNPYIDALAGVAQGYAGARAGRAGSTQAPRVPLSTGGQPGLPALQVPAGGVGWLDRSANPFVGRPYV